MKGLSIILLLWVHLSIAQDKVFLKVDQPPRFPGGEEAFALYIAKELKYPPLARHMGVQGSVLVEYIVEKDGRVGHVKVLRG
jgi:protein TonB